MVEEIGFVQHPSIEQAGASPDGLVGDDGLVEIKCPNTATHIETLLSQSVPAKYLPQIQWQLACTNRQWCDFVSFDPRMPEGAQLFIKQVTVDRDYIAQMEQEVCKFLSEVDQKLSQLRSIIK